MVNKDRRAAVMVIHGPNLNLLGRREPNIYGHGTLDELNKKIAETAQRLNIRVEIRQSNHEGEIIDLIQAAGGEFDGLIINAAAFTHYSLAIRDALAAIEIPAVEVHLSNIYQREDFRRQSVIAPVVRGQIAGFGPESYLLALRAAVALINGGDGE